MATLGTDESGRCKDVLNKSQCKNFFVRRDERSGRCSEVAFSGGSTLLSQYGYRNLAVGFLTLHVCTVVESNLLNSDSRKIVPDSKAKISDITETVLPYVGQDPC